MIENTSKSPRRDWLFGGNPAAIEAQEAEGQKQLVKSSQLPVEINSVPDIVKGFPAKAVYESMGIKVIGPTKGDDIFLDVVLPNGWQLKATDHSMWSNLLNDKGEIVATIFYKAAFYDRSSFINIK